MPDKPFAVMHTRSVFNRILGRQENAIAPAFESLANDDLTLFIAIIRRSVDIIDLQFKDWVNDADPIFLVENHLSLQILLQKPPGSET